MGGTRSDGEVTKAKGAMKEALGIIVGDEEIRAEGAAGKADGKAKAEAGSGKPPTRRPSTK